MDFMATGFCRKAFQPSRWDSFRFAGNPALKRRAISKGSFGTVFHRGSRREPALTFPPEKNERPAPTRRQPHGKFWPPRDGKVGTDPFMTNNGNYPKMF